MKTQKLALAFCAVAFLAACRAPHTAMSLTVMPDLTDTMAAFPDTSSILRCFEALNSDAYQGAAFRLVPITDISHNRAMEASIEPAAELRSNPLERGKAVSAFRERVKEAVIGVGKVPIGRPNSTVLEAVASEAARMANSSAERKVLVAYSDLRENGVVNLHSREGAARLTADREGLLEQLAREVPNANLNGIEIHLVYEAKDYKDSEGFKLMAEIYREVFESRGAKVFVGASFNP